MKKKSLRYVYDLGMYYAREDGEIEDENGRILSVYADGTVLVYPDAGLKKRVPAHQLIAHAFVPNPKDFKFVRFKDGDKRNRLPENLEWIPGKNVGTIRSRKAPLTAKQKAHQMREAGKSVADIAEALECSKMYVYNMLKMPAN